MCGRGWSTLVLSLGTSCWGLPCGGDQSASSIPLVPVGTLESALCFRNRQMTLFSRVD